MVDNQRNCPFCKSNKSEKANQILGYREGSNYLRHIQDSNEFKKHLKLVKLLKCKECNVVYPSRGIEQELIDTIYSKFKPSHDMGWNSYERSNFSYLSKTSYFYKLYLHIENLLNELSKENTKSFLNIAEFGCPFTGYALAEKWITGTTKELKIFDKPSSIISKIYIIINSLFLKIVNIFWMIRKYYIYSHSKNKNKKIYRKRNTIKTLIVDYSNYYWLGNCTRYGMSCTNLARQTIFQKVKSINQIEESNKDYFDCILMANSIDHYDNGLNIIERLARRTKSLVIIGHGEKKFSLQHSYAFTKESLIWLGSKIKSEHKNCIYETKETEVNGYNTLCLTIKNLNE